VFKRVLAKSRESKSGWHFVREQPVLGCIQTSGDIFKHTLLSKIEPD
jgi:hypothetical protein